MTAKVAINGFGRIGRNVFRTLVERGVDLDVVAINDLTDNKTLAHLLKYDSAHGRFGYPVDFNDDALIVDGKEIKAFAERNPADLPWAELGVDIVLECTGIFRTGEKLQPHLDAGAKKVILSVPGDGIDNTIVMGVNEGDYDPAKDKMVSNASCTTNCLAPFAKVLDDSFGIKRGLMTTIHAYTADQNLVDAPHSDLRRGRAAAANMVPTKTGAAKAIGEVLPNLNGKLDGFAVRVPVITGSVTDLTVELEKVATADEINAAMKAAAEGPMKGVLEYTEDPIVSSDIVSNTASSIFDAKMTKVIDGTMVKCLSWYDNEWGYSNRMVDVALLMASKGL
ncbi:MAG: type I glyceraldehyde-3-phosphate dehydrogenase [Cellulomonadaceae bacterium]|nr:type I glyceraldehyde-3-phosphate dehydrogenase [Cellulomonadaceae bacterium]